MKKIRKALSTVLAVILAFAFTFSYAQAAPTGNVRSAIMMEYLQSYGVEVNSSSKIEVTDLITSDGRRYDVIRVSDVLRDGEECVSIFFPTEQTKLGEVRIVDLKESIVEYSLAKESAQIMNSGSATKGGLTATAYYDLKTKSGQRYYRPYKLTARSTKSQTFSIRYAICGAPYNSDLVYQKTADEWFSISLSKNPATANVTYTQAGSSPYYFLTSSGAPALYHRVYFNNVGGTDYSYVNVTVD